MIPNIISSIFICLTIYSAYKEFRKDKHFLKRIYSERPLDYLYSLFLFAGVAFLVVSLNEAKLPSFFYWSWLSLFSKQGTNVISSPLFSDIPIIFILLFWAILSSALPYLARFEEEEFRSRVFGFKRRVLVNLKFGLVHMFMGVPLYVALILSFVGYFFSIVYNYNFKKLNKQSSFKNSDEISTFIATSIHAKYNFIIITFATIVSILLSIYK